LDEEKGSSDYQSMMSKKDNAKAKKSGRLQPLVDMVPENLVAAFSSSKLMLQVIFFALFFGIALSLMQTEGSKQVHRFFNAMGDVFVKMVNMIMALSPFFVFCLMAGVLAKIANTPAELFTLFQTLGLYSLVVVLGLALLLFVFYPLLQRIFGVKFGYREFYQKMSPAQFLAFSTSSSAATLPVTIKCVQEGLKVPKKVSDFVLPIGATVNMDGTSLYQAVAVIFLAQFHGVDLSMSQQLGIVATTTLASIGSAAVPSAGLIMLMFVLNSVGLNPMWIVIIYPIDRILDMCRTVINVSSDATVAAIVAKTEE
jgi:Na+/H+-dicarboxylate symporter